MPKNVILTDEIKVLIATEYTALRSTGMMAKDVEDCLCIKLGLSPRTIRNYKDYKQLLPINYEAIKGEYIASVDFELPQPKILLLDIETAPNLSYVWGHYEQNVIAHHTEWYMLSWSVRWLRGEPVTRCLADYPDYQAGSNDDKALVNELWPYINEADIIVWQNGDKFDQKKINTRFIKHDIRPPRPFRTVDTLKIARRHFAFNSNKLNDLGEYLGVGHKLEHKGFELWKGCLLGDMEAWATMKAYNEQDVELLQNVYLKLLPWIFNHSNTATLSNLVDACRNCGATQIVQEGFILTATGKRPQYKCEYCGTWMQGKHQSIQTLR